MKSANSMDFSEAWDDTCSTVGLCARHGNLTEMQRLVENGSCVYNADNRGWRPLHEAAVVPDSIECLEELLKHEDTDANWRTHEGETALLLACKRRLGGNADRAVELLLRFHADPNLSDNEEETPILVATKNNNFPVVAQLIAANADPNAGDCSGWRPLHQAAMHGHAEILNCLLVAGANINVRDECGMTPIFTASQHGQESCLHVLLEKAEQRDQSMVVNIGAEDWATPLMIAAQQGYANCVRILLDHGANPNLKTSDNITALHLAVQCNQADCLHLLVEKMELDTLIKSCHPMVYDVNKPVAPEAECISPLHLAVEWQSYECLQVLLSAGFSPDSIYQRTSHLVDFFLPTDQAYHESALSYAVFKEDKDAISMLLKAGATSSSVTPFSLHPAIRALSKPSPNMLDILLDNGTDLNPSTNDVFLAAIVTQYHLEKVLQHGCNPQNCFEDGSLELFVSAIVTNSNRSNLANMLDLILQYIVVNAASQKAYSHVKRQLYIHLNNNIDDIHNTILKQLEHPSLLKQICRIGIRHHMYSLHGPRFVHFIPRLSLPLAIENYILYKTPNLYSY